MLLRRLNIQGNDDLILKVWGFSYDLPRSAKDSEEEVKSQALIRR